MESGIHGDINHRYANAGIEDDQIIEEAAKAFWHAVIDGNKEEVANHLDYPIVVVVGGQRKKISNKTSFIENYEKIFTPDFVQLLEGYVPHNMFLLLHKPQPIDRQMKELYLIV